MDSSNSDRPITPYLLLAGGIILLALAGYLGYVTYPRFDLPAVSGISLLLLAVAAGIGSFFAPCSFPLLVTLLARSTDDDRDSSSLSRGIRFGASLALGASLFLLLTGAAIALGAGTIFQQVKFASTAGRIIRAVVGLLLIVMGLTQLDALSLPFSPVSQVGRALQKRQAQMREQHPYTAFTILGFGYILAGFG